jgi:hypothetical protein
VEQAIVITRSQLRQVIEGYIAASRVGDTLSYVETAKLSAAEAAESSTSRIWDGLSAADNVPPTQFERGATLLAMTPEDMEIARALGEMPAGSFSEAPLITEFTCAEDLRAGQVVIVNSRGMIEGKRDEADCTIMSDAIGSQPEPHVPEDNDSMFN